VIPTASVGISSGLRRRVAEADRCPESESESQRARGGWFCSASLLDTEEKQRERCAPFHSVAIVAATSWDWGWTSLVLLAKPSSLRLGRNSRRLGRNSTRLGRNNLDGLRPGLPVSAGQAFCRTNIFPHAVFFCNILPPCFFLQSYWRHSEA